MKQFSWDVFYIKITSRKFWVSLAGLITALLAFFKADNDTIVQVAAIIGALGTVIGYLIANGLSEDGTTAGTADQQDAAGE
jgi:uncharacterized membrane protein